MGTAEKRREFLLKFKGYIEQHQNEDFWKDPAEISRITQTDENETMENIQSLNDFVENSKGKYTTRDLYEKRSSQLKKIVDQINNKIR